MTLIGHYSVTLACSHASVSSDACASDVEVASVSTLEWHVLSQRVSHLLQVIQMTQLACRSTYHLRITGAVSNATNHLKSSISASNTQSGHRGIRLVKLPFKMQSRRYSESRYAVCHWTLRIDVLPTEMPNWGL